MTARNNKIKLLLVDDETEFLDATAKALMHRGFEVKTAPNGNFALSLLRSETFDAAVLDVKMPGIPGDQLFREMQLHWPEMPTIILTGHGNVQQAFQTSREGIFDYLTKPFDIDVMTQVIRKAVASRRGKTPSDVTEKAEGRVRLLIVDDEWEMLDSLAPVLSRRDMVVSVARSSAHALDLIDKQLFDVALVDVKMPMIDGMALLTLIKKALPFCEVILFSGQPTVDIAVQGVKDGAFDFMVKPQDIDALTAKIREAYRQGRLKAAEAEQSKIDEIRERHRD